MHAYLSLGELHLSLNDYSLSSPPPAAPLFPSLHTLHISGCRLSAWPRLAAVLAPFPCLEDLVAADNPLPSFGPPAVRTRGELEEALGSLLGCLTSLNINGWALEGWEDVEKITALTLLSDLRLNHVPLLDALSEKEGRTHVLARLPTIATYNGSDVSRDERENAERAFLRHFAATPDEAKPTR